jgi:hypothetical protein
MDFFVRYLRRIRFIYNVRVWKDESGMKKIDFYYFIVYWLYVGWNVCL